MKEQGINSSTASLEGFFTPDECEHMLYLGARQPLVPGEVYGSGGSGLNETIRKCTTRHIELEEEGWAPYIRKLDEFIRQVNEKTWQYDLTGFEEPLKFMSYEAGEHFNHWHMDTGKGYTSRRKITAMVQLSPPTAYKGGRWEFMPPCGCGKLVKQGSILVFPSVRPHRLTPVESGHRYSLISWMSGPPLR